MVKSFHKLTIEAPASEVYNVLTSIDGIKKWYMEEISGDASEVGAEMEYGDKEMWYNKMKVVDLEENKKVVWDIVEASGKMPGASDWENTKISFDLEEKQLERLNGKTVTVLMFKHEGFKHGFDDTKQYAEINWYWGFLLLSLKNVAEGKEGMAM